jgi:hypothetical protein
MAAVVTVVSSTASNIDAITDKDHGGVPPKAGSLLITLA